MNEEEQAFLEGLPNELVVYRGHLDRNRLNPGWTLSPSIARWFAQRFGPDGVVIRGVARKGDIHALFLRRDEYEVVIDPAAVTGAETVRPLQRSDYYKDLLSQAQARFRLPENRSFHGPTHWEQVEFFGRALCDLVGDADPQVVQHFAIVHDACRESEGEDPYHGHRAAAWVKHLDLELDKDQKRKLDTALRLHNDGQTSDDPTIGACWDADRLDLPRVGITPDLGLLSTEAARGNIWRM
jgi:uncharacterized protein